MPEETDPIEFEITPEVAEHIDLVIEECERIEAEMN